jgi:hypothetical protein
VKWNGIEKSKEATFSIIRITIVGFGTSHCTQNLITKQVMILFNNSNLTGGGHGRQVSSPIVSF